MQANTFLLIIGSVAMSAFAQILLKTGMSNVQIGASLAARRWAELALQVSTNQWVVLGLLLYFLSAVVWLGVLARVEVSFAYPFVGIGFVFTMLLGWLLMGDAINLQRVAGTLMIAGGVVLIARGG
jgi:multidrug transporter EmrE-like cation transporter